jgi:diacylglycerol kinase (ATP)
MIRRRGPDLCVIYNASAGRGRAAGQWQQLRSLLQGRAALWPTTAKGHAHDLARQAAHAGFKTVAAAGGDGTVHEVAAGLVASGRLDVALGVLPLGSGNDYARMLGVPFQPESMVRQVLSGQSWQVDVGEVRLDGGSPGYFFNSLGLGLSAAVTWEASRIRRLRGLPLYGLAALLAIARHYHSIPIRWEEDGTERATHLLYLAVALGRAEGGGFVIAPDARLDDGWFDLLHVTALSQLGALAYLPRMILGLLPASSDAISRRQARHFKITSDLPLPVHADGELLRSPRDGSRQCEVTLLPGRLNVRARSPENQERVIKMGSPGSAKL